MGSQDNGENIRTREQTELKGDKLSEISISECGWVNIRDCGSLDLLLSWNRILLDFALASVHVVYNAIFLKILR